MAPGFLLTLSSKLSSSSSSSLQNCWANNILQTFFHKIKLDLWTFYCVIFFFISFNDGSSSSTATRVCLILDSDPRQLLKCPQLLQQKNHFPFLELLLGLRRSHLLTPSHNFFPLFFSFKKKHLRCKTFVVEFIIVGLIKQAVVT